MLNAAPQIQALLAQARSARELGDMVSARKLYRSGWALNPHDASLALDVAAAELGLADASQAQAVLHAIERPSDRALRWRFDMINALSHKRLQQPDAAWSAFQAALAAPELPPTVAQQAKREAADLLLNVLGDPQSAARLYDRTDPSEAGQFTRLVAALYSGDMPSDDLVNAFRAHAAAFIASPASPSEPTTEAGKARRLTRPKSGSRRLRIGWISGQWCASPVGFLTLGSIEALVGQAELVIFDRGSKLDWANSRFRQAASEWHACAGMTPDALADLARKADVDALVDLGGWMDPDALRALSMRPVARQFKWVGGQSLTTGLTCFGGFWADARQIPVTSDTFYNEPIQRFRHGYVTYTSAPYRDFSVQSGDLPLPKAAAQGSYAIVSNPAKIGAAMRDWLDLLQPRRLHLVDWRWRFAHARHAVQARLGRWGDGVEFVAPSNHPEYLHALDGLDATFLDTAPYSMGLTAIELRLLGKPILLPKRPRVATMRELHCAGHLRAARFDHHRDQAEQILRWCTA
jgi:predicted O-linked N-acetylglucosamine transferase (SPINDLY family)